MKGRATTMNAANSSRGSRYLYLYTQVGSSWKSEVRPVPRASAPASEARMQGTATGAADDRFTGSGMKTRRVRKRYAHSRLSPNRADTCYTDKAAPTQSRNSPTRLRKSAPVGMPWPPGWEKMAG